MVEVPDIDPPEPTGLIEQPAALERHLVHHAEQLPARRPRQSRLGRLERTEHARRQLLLAQRRLDQWYHAPLKRLQLRHPLHPGPRSKQRSRMHEQQTLAPLEQTTLAYQSSPHAALSTRISFSFPSRDKSLFVHPTTINPPTLLSPTIACPRSRSRFVSLALPWFLTTLAHVVTRGERVVRNPKPQAQETGAPPKRHG